MKKIIVLLAVGFALLGANVNHEIKVSTGDDMLDSVLCSCFTAQAGVIPPASVATFKLATFPNDTLVTIPDTCNVKISCLYYFTGITGYLLSSELVPSSPLTPSDNPFNLVNNGSMERPGAGGLPQGWYNISGTTTQSTAAAQGGKYGIRLAGTGAAPGAVGSDSIYINGNQRIYFGGKGLDHSGSTAHIHLCDSAGAELASADVHVPFTWQTTSQVYEHTSITGGFFFMKLERDGNATTDTAYFDDVYLYVEERLNNYDTLREIASNVIGANQLATSGVLEIANQVHDADTTGHLAALGDPGKMAFHYSRTGAGGGGSSACGDSLGYTRTIVLIDTSAVPDVVLNGIDIYFNNQPQSGEPYRVTTNNLGRASLGLNAGNWVRLHTDARYLPDTDSFTVVGTGIDTMRLCQVVLLDTDTLTTTVVFYIKKPNGTPNDSAAITIELLPYNRDSILYISNTIIAASYAQWPLKGNAAGIASEQLYGNALFTNDSSYYRATVRNRYNDKILDVFKFRVPVSDSVNYAHLLPRWK